MKRAKLLGLMVAALLGIPSAAVADTDADSDENHGQFVVDGNKSSQGSNNAAPVGDQPIGEYHVKRVCGEICTDDLTCPNGGFRMHAWIESPSGEVIWDSYYCSGESAPAPTVTPGLVATALRRIDLPNSELVIQPPDGKTLVNFETNFYTEAEPFNRTVRLLGQQVELRIETHSFTWHFDDGDSVTTEEPGTPYPKLTVTHDYLQVGQYAPSVDTTWVADFRVNGGPWRPVPGSVTIDGDPVGLRAIEARPTLVGYDG